MDEIDKNIQAFNLMSNDLEKESLGKWVLFHNEKLIKIFETFEDAAEYGRENFKVGTYLVRQVGFNSITLPVSVAVR